MPDKFTTLSPELYAYAIEHGARQDDLLRRLAEETESKLADVAIMQIAPDQGAFMTMLMRLMGARRALELGTFTGYSAICIARGLPDDGELVTCDLSDEWTAIARRYWEEAGVAERIDLRLGPALETIRGLPSEEPFDFAFIDADKSEYPDYYEECLRLLRPGGPRDARQRVPRRQGARRGRRRSPHTAPPARSTTAPRPTSGSTS